MPAIPSQGTIGHHYTFNVQKRMRSALIFLASSCLLLTACAGANSRGKSPDSATGSDAVQGPGPDSIVLGEFVDDYGIPHEIDEAQWLQRPNSRFRITKWNSEAMYLIAQNHPDNPEEGGLWTRIDWVLLPDMPDYPWAFCLSAYDAPSAEQAEATRIDRTQPRSGCNGFPFSRMRVLSEQASPEQ